MSKKAAFTLIELLVVISIILIASSIIFIGGTGGDGAKLSSAQRIVSGIAQGARGQAILKNANTRLIIYSDSASNLMTKEIEVFRHHLRGDGYACWRRLARCHSRHLLARRHLFQQRPE